MVQTLVDHGACVDSLTKVWECLVVLGVFGGFGGFWWFWGLLGILGAVKFEGKGRGWGKELVNYNR